MQLEIIILASLSGCLKIVTIGRLVIGKQRGREGGDLFWMSLTRVLGWTSLHLRD